MNTRTIQSAVALLVMVGMLGACTAGKSPGTASGNPPTDAAKPVAVVAHPSEAPADEAAAMQIPDTADAIWKAIDQQSSDLKTTIQSGALKDVHHKAFAIRDLVAALSAHSPTLTADDRSKLAGEVKFVATLADRLDAAGDSNDKAGAQASYDKLVTVLSGITRSK